MEGDDKIEESGIDNHRPSWWPGRCSSLRVRVYTPPHPLAVDPKTPRQTVRDDNLIAERPGRVALLVGTCCDERHALPLAALTISSGETDRHSQDQPARATLDRARLTDVTSITLTESLISVPAQEIALHGKASRAKAPGRRRADSRAGRRARAASPTTQQAGQLRQLRPAQGPSTSRRELRLNLGLGPGPGPGPGPNASNREMPCRTTSQAGHRVSTDLEN